MTHHTYLLYFGTEGCEFDQVRLMGKGTLKFIRNHLKQTNLIGGLYWLVREDDGRESIPSYFNECKNHKICNYKHEPFKSFVDLRAPLRSWGPLATLVSYEAYERSRNIHPNL